MLKPIRTKKEYKAAVERIYELMQKNIKVNSYWFYLEFPVAF